ncbi:hypothetical protein RRG08_001827 [Elysia crispata]|uniref:Uncharacterized protein n=1 Tax=Elysia crispata TaxID=231223 RepID=A0AAE0Y817_9GAST|nr:hypothetical protein RRG08_001827 [Elysia crispata]
MRSVCEGMTYKSLACGSAKVSVECQQSEFCPKWLERPVRVFMKASSEFLRSNRNKALDSQTCRETNESIDVELFYFMSVAQ